HGRKDGETFGAVLAEAMMHGKPCLSHRSGVADAQPETMGPGGLFASDEEGYVRLLSSLLSDSELRGSLAEKGRQHARHRYSAEACLSQLVLLYRQLIADPAFEQITNWKRRLRYFFRLAR